MKSPDIVSEPCPACGRTSLTPWFAKASNQGHYNLVRCLGCRSAFVMPRPSPDEIEAYYRAWTYQNDGGESAEDRLEIVRRSEAIYPNCTLDAARIAKNCRRWAGPGRFLDIGAGYGYFSKAAADQGFEITAMEPSPNSREVFHLVNGFHAAPSLLENDFVLSHQGTFNVVLMSQVLEHIAEVEWTVTALATLLKDGGVAAIAVPHFRSLVSVIQGKKDMFIIPPEHLNFFTVRGLEALFRRHGFEVIASETISRFDPARLRKRLRPRSLAHAASLSLKAALAVSDIASKGMFINAYFRKLGAV